MNKILFLHPNIQDIDGMLNYLGINDLDVKRNLEWSAKDPDIVIASETIYSHPKYFSEFKKLYNHRDRIFIFHGGESAYPDLNIFDYALGYCTYLKEFDRIVKIPEQLFFLHEDELKDNKYDYDLALNDVQNKKFCSFIYSNSKAHPNRDKFFYALNEYKKVSSLGGHLNNTDTVSGRDKGSWLEDSIKIKNEYKFSIAFENELYYGYTTEKLLTSFKAHTLPIYWGNPKVCDFYNSKAFINCHDYDSFEDVINKIKEIDANDELWAEFVSQPWQTNEQKIKSKEIMNVYTDFWYKILMAENLSDYMRRPYGTWTSMYYKWFFRVYADSFIKKVWRKIKY